MAVFVAIALLVWIAVMFAAAFVAASAARPMEQQPANASAYEAEVTAALAGARAAEGEALIDAYQCGICHVQGSERVAPRFAGIAERAGNRRAPLPGADYLYESIIRPGAYLVEGYANAMPANYAERLSQAQIGHIVAYLLTQ